jgi:hypothetical protein
MRRMSSYFSRILSIFYDQICNVFMIETFVFSIFIQMSVFDYLCQSFIKLGLVSIEGYRSVIDDDPVPDIDW